MILSPLSEVRKSEGVFRPYPGAHLLTLMQVLREETDLYLLIHIFPYLDDTMRGRTEHTDHASCTVSGWIGR